MQALEDSVLAFLLGQIVKTRGALLARGQGLRALVFEEVFFLAKTLVASARAVVGCRGGCWAKEEWFLFDALGELLGCGIGRVGACEEGMRYMGWWSR